MSIINRINIVLVVVVILQGCSSTRKKNEQDLLIQITKKLNDDGNGIFGNTFLRWDEIHGKADDIFYKDSIVIKLHIKKKYQQFAPDLLNLDYDEIRSFIEKPDSTLLSIAPYLDSLDIVDGTQFEVLSNYLSKSRKERGSHCFYFFAKPIFADNRFAFIYIDTFCGRENASGELYVYMLIDGKWQSIAYELFYIS